MAFGIHGVSSTEDFFKVYLVGAGGSATGGDDGRMDLIHQQRKIDEGEEATFCAFQILLIAGRIFGTIVDA